MGQSIDAACVRPAPVGRVTDWTFRPQGSDPVRWDWSLGPPDVRGLRPIRNPRSTERSRHIPVQAHCFVTGTTLKLESGLEYDLLLMLERDPTAAWFVPQPARLGVRLPNGRRTIHTPDLLMLATAGRVTIWNVRSEERQDEKFRIQSDATAAACRDVGWDYDVFPGHSRPKKYNLRWLAAYRHDRPWYEAAKPELAEMCAAGATTNDVLEADRGSGHLVSAMWHYAWRGDLIVDIDQWIGRTAPIAWAHGACDD